MNTYQIYIVDEFGDAIERFTHTFKALTPSKAKYQAYQYWENFGYDFTFKEFLQGLKCKCIGRTKPSDYFSCPDQFNRVKKDRGIGFAFQGMKVEVDGKKGFITGGNSSGNIDVLFDGWEYVSNCHPWWDIKYFDPNGNLVKLYGRS